MLCDQGLQSEMSVAELPLRRTIMARLTPALGSDLTAEETRP